MKIIIAYASAGSGHYKAAEAIYSYFNAHKQNNIELKLIDVLEKSNILFKNIYSYGYVFIVSYATWLWAVAFKTTHVKSLRTIIKWLRFIINRINTKNFSQVLIRENPDCIISTHFLPSEIAAYLKLKRKINSKIATVITDFGMHPFWLLEGADMYIVASNYTKEKLVAEGIEEEVIKVFGIPVDSKFLRAYEKDSLCEKFGVQKDKFTVLITTGSFGIGPIEKIVDLLYRQTQILVVCAQNRRLYRKLRSKKYPGVLVFGFINNLQELMAISDIIITKPGGLTISESLAMELLPIFITAIPGQETENIKILAQDEMGIYVRNLDSLKDIILDFKAHPDKLKKIKEKIKEIKKPFATEKLYHALC